MVVDAGIRELTRPTAKLRLNGKKKQHEFPRKEITPEFQRRQQPLVDVFEKYGAGVLAMEYEKIEGPS